jgi:hypothetical protein
MAMLLVLFDLTRGIALLVSVGYALTHWAAA